MNLDWKTIDRYLMGEAWTGSHIARHAQTLCEEIGPRWSSTDAESRAIQYIHEQMVNDGLDRAEIEPFELHTWSYSKAEALSADGQALDLVPFNRCPPCSINARLVDVGFGTPHKLEAAGQNLSGAIAVMNLGHEPFTTPVPHTDRLSHLAQAGAAAVICIDSKTGRRAEYHNAGDWRDPERAEPPLPVATTSREHGALLRRFAARGNFLKLTVESQFYDAPSANVVGQLDGVLWPDEHLVLGGHHDTVLCAPGGNDNASGTIAVLETARVLAGLKRDLGISPGRAIRFVTFAAEEQVFQGAIAYVARHYGPEKPPRLAINLDELSTGYMKGIVLAFEHLRPFVQNQLDDLGDGLECHVMAQLDASSDHFPFLRKTIDAAHLWRWRFKGRHPDADFHHEAADTIDKLNTRELKEYAGQLARLLLRLSHQSPGAWPENPMTEEKVQQRLEAERGTIVRVY
jgi:aminopeptidase YwaD